MKQKGVMEIISFNVLDSCTEDQVTEGLRQLERFQNQFETCHEMQIAKADKSITLVITYDSFDDERKISASMMKSETTNDFKKLVDPHTVNKAVYPHYVLTQAE